MNDAIAIILFIWFILDIKLMNQKARDLMRSRKQDKQISKNKAHLTNEIAHVSTIAFIWAPAIIIFVLGVLGILIDRK